MNMWGVALLIFLIFLKYPMGYLLKGGGDRGSSEHPEPPLDPALMSKVLIQCTPSGRRLLRSSKASDSLRMNHLLTRSTTYIEKVRATSALSQSNVKFCILKVCKAFWNF